MVLFGTINQAMFDWPWSGIHLVSGLCIGALLAILVYQRRPGRFWTVGVGLLVLWEIVEKTLQYFDVHAHQAIAPLKQAVSGFAFAPETVANTTGDLIIGAVGTLIGLILMRRIARKP
ncbi:MAG: hypothetical protein AAB619_00010 [Patescibacteria group bacterium]